MTNHNDLIQNFLSNPEISDWAKEALLAALKVDPSQAADDAEQLSRVLDDLNFEAILRLKGAA